MNLVMITIRNIFGGIIFLFGLSLAIYGAEEDNYHYTASGVTAMLGAYVAMNKDERNNNTPAHYYDFEQLIKRIEKLERKNDD